MRARAHDPRRADPAPIAAGDAQPLGSPTAKRGRDPAAPEDAPAKKYHLDGVASHTAHTRVLALRCAARDATAHTVLETVKLSQTQNGLRHGDYLRYRSVHLLARACGA